MIEQPNKTELKIFYCTSMQSAKKPAILKILPHFAYNFKPDARNKQPLTKL